MSQLGGAGRSVALVKPVAARPRNGGRPAVVGFPAPARTPRLAPVGVSGLDFQPIQGGQQIGI